MIWFFAITLCVIAAVSSQVLDIYYPKINVYNIDAEESHWYVKLLQLISTFSAIFIGVLYIYSYFENNLLNLFILIFVFICPAIIMVLTNHIVKKYIIKDKSYIKKNELLKYSYNYSEKFILKSFKLVLNELSTDKMLFFSSYKKYLSLTNPNINSRMYSFINSGQNICIAQVFQSIRNEGFSKNEMNRLENSVDLKLKSGVNYLIKFYTNTIRDKGFHALSMSHWYYITAAILIKYANFGKIEVNGDSIFNMVELIMYKLIEEVDFNNNEYYFKKEVESKNNLFKEAFTKLNSQ